jgi:hypothetical protein
MQAFLGFPRFVDAARLGGIRRNRCIRGAADLRDVDAR